VVCLISNFSYLSDPSYVVMRQSFLKSFDQFWFDSLNGDSRETGKLTPEGKPDPSVFSSEYNREGIRTGTAIALMVQTGLQKDKAIVRFRQLWGVSKRQDLLASLQAKKFNTQYAFSKPIPETRFSFRPSNISEHYLEWAKLTDLCAVAPSNGLMEKRGGALIDIDRNALAERMRAYFDADIGWEAYQKLGYGLVKPQARFDPKVARRKALLSKSFDERRLQRYAIRPFEVRWCYYSEIRPIWNESRPFLWKQCWEGNKFFITRFKAAKDDEGTPFYFTPCLSDDHLLTPDAVAIPLQLMNGARIRPKEQLSLLEVLGEKPEVDRPFANLSTSARQYLNNLGLPNPDEDADTAILIWMHALAIGYSPAYLQQNHDGIHQDFPRIPLPNSQDLLIASANLGKELAKLLDIETKVEGVTLGTILPELRSIAAISKVGGGQLNPDQELALTAGWGHAGKEGVTMPGKGKIQKREYSADELKTLDQSMQTLLGKTTRDIYLNDVAYWKNMPVRVWDYTIGGYQVIKKWLSYREETLLGRSLKSEEVREVSNMARRIAAILLLETQLDTNYEVIKQATYDWQQFLR